LPVVLAFAGVVPACSNDCYTPVERSITLSLPATDPALDFAIESCHVDVGACVDLCVAALKRLREDFIPDTCDVKFYDTEVDLDVKYQVGGGSCGGIDQPAQGDGSTALRTPTDLMTDSPEPRIIGPGLYGQTTG
jgi:hypothetical protein